MPDAGDAPAPAAAANALHASAADASPDRVGEELADDAHIWRVYDRVAKEDDDRRIASWNRGLDNLALFAGLFSAVTTAFIIEAQNDMKPDYAQLTFQVLNASVFDQQFIPEPFAIPSCARSVNCLWISSLVLSLSAALIAIMGKDWIGMYASRPVCNPRQWAEMRTYRLRCVERWYMSGVIAVAPVLLHVSLLLFGAGLVGFMSTDHLTQRLTLVLCLLAGILYVATALSAVLFPGSPFKSPASQMIRATIPDIILFLRVTFSPPNRNALFTLQRAINEVVAPGLLSDSLHPRRSLRRRLACVFRDTGLPGPEPRRLRSPGSLLRSGYTTVGSAMRSLSALPRVFMDEFFYRRQRPRSRPYWSAVVSWYRHLRVREAFIGSSWTDTSVDRRPALLSDSLTWLNNASQAPDVLRALIFALGDLEIGQQVGQFASSELCARIKTEIRHVWREADYATLSRYVLADRNLAQGPVIQPAEFFSRYNMEGNPSLRCEHGLAASVVISSPSNSQWTPKFSLSACIPDQLGQPRLAEFLLPRIARDGIEALERFVLLVARYWSSLRVLDTFNLEVELYERLHPQHRTEYAAWVADRCAGRGGPIEFLTFISCKYWGYARREDYLGLMMQILDSTPGGPREAGCLVYLFQIPNGLHVGRCGDLRASDWTENILLALIPSMNRYHAQNLCTLARPSARFAVALARTVVVLFSPSWRDVDPLCTCLWYLYEQLCDPRSLLNDGDKAEVVELLLQQAALSMILYTDIDFDAEAAICGFQILVAVTCFVAQRLAQPQHFDHGVRLFGHLAFAEARHPLGESVVWELREWLLDEALYILHRHPRSGASLGKFHDAMTSIYPLCANNDELRAHWDRIGYPGRPGDTFSDPLLDLGRFFLVAESRYNPLWD